MQDDHDNLEEQAKPDDISAKIDQALSEANADSSQKDESSTHRADSAETGKVSEGVVSREPIARWSDFVPSSSIAFLACYLLTIGFFINLSAESATDPAAGWLGLIFMLVGSPVGAVISVISLVSVPIYFMRHHLSRAIAVVCSAAFLMSAVAFIYFSRFLVVWVMNIVR